MNDAVLEKVSLGSSSKVKYGITFVVYFLLISGFGELSGRRLLEAQAGQRLGIRSRDE